MVELWVARHGQTEYNVRGIVQGIVDSQLTSSGVSDAMALGRGLAEAGINFDAAYSSNLHRAVETANLALTAGRQRLQVHKWFGLREQSFGMFEGHSEAQRAAAMIELTKSTDRFGLPYFTVDQVAELSHIVNLHHGVTGTENVAAIQRRFNDTVGIIAQRAAATNQQNVLLVSHGAVIWLWLASLGMPKDSASIGNAAVAHVSYERGQFRLRTYNDRSYVFAGAEQYGNVALG